AERAEPGEEGVNPRERALRNTAVVVPHQLRERLRHRLWVDGTEADLVEGDAEVRHEQRLEHQVVLDVEGHQVTAHQNEVVDLQSALRQPPRDLNGEHAAEAVPDELE